jgi:hypothetical protein
MTTMTDEEAIAEIRKGLTFQENFRHFETEGRALEHIATRLAALRERETEEADPHCAYCAVRESAHDTDPAACLVFTTGSL